MSKRTNKKRFFIVGTDTNVGKTLIAASLSQALIKCGKSVCAIKPVASGGDNDVKILKKYSTPNNLSISDINPFLFYDSIAPHLAAKKEGVELSVSAIVKKTSRALNCDADYIIIEGAGGWYTPLGDRESMADLALAYNCPIILVVGIRLGCINHAVLTYECMCNSGVKIAGWVANVVDKKMVYVGENIESLKLIIRAPLLGIVPYIKRLNRRQSP